MDSLRFCRRVSLNKLFDLLLELSLLSTDIGSLGLCLEHGSILALLENWKLEHLLLEVVFLVMINLDIVDSMLSS